MRTLLLGTKVGSVGWVHGLENLWPLFNEGSFFLLLFTKNQLENETQVWQSLNNCLFKIGILSKKGVSGKKSFFKSIRSEPQIKEEESIRQDNTDTINSSAEGIPE